MMRKKLQGMAVIAALLALAFAMVTMSCPDPTGGGGGGGNPTAVNGVWESSDGKKLTFSGNSFTRIPGSSTLDYKGTFSLSEGTINFNISQYSLNGGSSWLSYNQYIDERIKEYVGESSWNAMTAAQKQTAREYYTNPIMGITLIAKPPTTDTATYDLILDGKQLKVIYAGDGSEASRTVIYQKAGTSMVSTALVGKWVIEDAPTVVVLDFSTSQLKLVRSTTTYTYYTLETDGKIEIGTNPGEFTQDFCDSYTITGDTLTFTGGSSADWYPSATFKKYVFPPYTPTPLTADQWTDGTITSSVREAWYSFNVTNGTTYRVWWNDNDAYATGGDGTKSLDVKASGYYSDGTVIFNDIDNGWSTPATATRFFTASKSGPVYVKVIPYSTVGTPTGTFGIVYSSTATTRPGIVFNPPSNTTPLTANVWADGEITSSETEDWYSFSVTSGNNFYVWWNDSYISTSGNRIKTLDVRVTAFYADGTTVTGFTAVDSAWGTPQSISPTADATVYLRVVSKTSGNIGTYGIVYSNANTRPDVSVAPAGAIALAADVWANGAITTAGGEVWYSFPVTNGTPYRLWGDGSGNGLFRTLANMRVSAWYNNGNNIFYDQYAPWSSPQTITPTADGTVYVRVYASTSSNTGTFGLLYSSTVTTRPDVPLDPEGIPNLIPLTAGEWKSGEITASNRVAWYSFDVTSGDNFYIWWNESGGPTYGDSSKTLNISVNAYYNDGTSIFTNGDYAWSTPRTFIPTANGTVYVRVSQYLSASYGTYGIVYNTTNTRPPVPFEPVNPTTLTADQWADGIIAISGGQQWFKFTATAATQYIHGFFGSLNDLYVQVYESNGSTVGAESELYSSTRNINRSLTLEQEYYIRVRPYSSFGSGNYLIAFNTSSAAPAFNPPNLTTLTEGQWASGNIPTSSGQQWFKFTATATDQYIHVIFGTLNDMYVQFYNSNGGIEGSSSGQNLYNNTRSANRTLVIGQDYYVRVWPYDSDKSGNYQITFNTSAIAPTP
jgi:hypothetical protein